jgi:hypothetical protein
MQINEVEKPGWRPGPGAPGAAAVQEKVTGAVDFAGLARRSGEQEENPETLIKEEA